MAHVDWPGGVNADELHHHLAALTGLDVSELVAGLPHRFHLLPQPGLIQVEIDEPRRRGFNPVDDVAGGDVGGQRLGQLQGIDPGGAGQAQGQVGGEIAVVRVARPLHLNLGHGFQLQRAFLAGGFQGPGHELLDGFDQ